MQTERVTYLTTAEQKAALEKFAKANGKSVGNIVREATASYMAAPKSNGDEEALLDLLIKELEAALPRWNARFDSMEASLDHAHREVRKALAAVEATK